MEMERIIQYICTFLGVISLSFIYAQMFRKTKPTKKNRPGVHCFLYIKCYNFSRYDKETGINV